MSIVRVSALKGAVYGVEETGAFVHGAYDRRRFVGQTEELKEPDEAGGGLPAVEPGSEPMSWQDADRRGFPRENSTLMHLMTERMAPAVANLNGPVVLMVHGFLFDPRDTVGAKPEDSDNAHSRLYHFIDGDRDREIRHHTTSWPLHLGFGESDADGADGLALGYCWHSRPGFASSLIDKFQNFYSRAYANAEGASWNLLTVLHCMDRLLPEGRRVDLFCHSLGSRVIIRMLAHAAKHGRRDLLARIDRVIILGGAEYVVEARLMLKRLHKAGATAHIQIYNIVSRENDVLDKLGENFGPMTFGNSNVIGHNGLDVEDPRSLGPNWLDLQIDGRELQTWMQEKRQLTVTGDNPDSVWDHWYYYTDRQNMELYRSILRHRDDWNIAALRAEGIPDRVSRRRSVFGD